MPNESLGGRARARRAERADAPRMPIGRFATAPIATPPASVALRTSAGRRRGPAAAASDASSESANAMTVDEQSASTVLTTARAIWCEPSSSDRAESAGQ